MMLEIMTFWWVTCNLTCWSKPFNIHWLSSQNQLECHLCAVYQQLILLICHILHVFFDFVIIATFEFPNFPTEHLFRNLFQEKKTTQHLFATILMYVFGKKSSLGCMCLISLAPLSKFKMNYTITIISKVSCQRRLPILEARS
jgi:hypothetical protein